jgi:hypothetical protein
MMGTLTEKLNKAVDDFVAENGTTLVMDGSVPCPCCGAMPESSGLMVHATHCAFWQYGSATTPEDSTSEIIELRKRVEDLEFQLNAMQKIADENHWEIAAGVDDSSP